MTIEFQGQVTIQGITESDLAMILEYKVRKPVFNFSPIGLQPAQHQPAHPQIRYNNCIIAWKTEEGMKEVRTVIHKLIHGHDKDPD